MTYIAKTCYLFPLQRFILLGS